MIYERKYKSNQTEMRIKSRNSLATKKVSQFFSKKYCPYENFQYKLM